ncbi:MAG TPA: hypothetical protein PK680_00350 [Novosphingobium sp.]|nr:hypothetical protein [Novosphingobium sp.]HQA16807.1 hypothetical protein [Novosphingobium sp.]
MRVYHSVAAAMIAAMLAGPALAKDKAPPPPPPAFQDLIKCRELADPAARLACYDAQAAKLEQATAAGDVVVSDRAGVREAQRGLFGFRLPSLGLFGGGNDGGDEIKSIDGVIASARTFGYGAWRITLEDGSVWEQTDGERPVFDPAKGDKVKIYKGALSTFRMNVAGQRAIKVRRVE